MLYNYMQGKPGQPQDKPHDRLLHQGSDLNTPRHRSVSTCAFFIMGQVGRMTTLQAQMVFANALVLTVVMHFGDNALGSVFLSFLCFSVWLNMDRLGMLEMQPKVISERASKRMLPIQFSPCFTKVVWSIMNLQQ